jgi:hypothetical protein
VADEPAGSDGPDETGQSPDETSGGSGKPAAAPAGRGRRPSDDDGQPSPALRHLKRYGPFYGIAVVVLLVVVLVQPGGGGDDDADSGSSAAASTNGNGDGPWAPGSGDLVHGTGTTRGGEACEEGEVQNPFTPLSVPCLPEFDGDNGGETYRGVTDDTIRIVVREFPDTANSLALDQEREDAGLASDADTEEIRDLFLPWFNENYELYGRQVELVPYESQFGDATQETLGQGREGACQDATRIAEEMDAFGVVSEVGGANSAVFAECAAERDLVVFAGATNYPESFFEDLHPFVWNTTMSCDRIAEHSAAYIGNRLIGDTAQFAGDPDLASQERLIGSYTPDNDAYVSCTNRSREILQEEYGAEGTQPIFYALDISQFSDQAARAVLQWKDDGVTTVILSADPISISYITGHAQAQDYHPEWIITGSAGNDTNTFGRDYNQDAVDGHLFGISQVSSSEDINGPNSDPGRLYEHLTGDDIIAGTTGEFFNLTHMFNMLQAAGPELTPDNMAAGVQAMPPMGGDGRVIWHFGDEHTATRDVREVYWDGSAPPAPDEDQDLEGSYIATYDGRRFLPDEWPAEAPPIYPDR